MGNTLKVNNLTASYKNETILNNISFSISDGDFICLCGPNGCGKSTLLSCLSNLQNNSLNISKNAEILLDDIKINKIKQTELAKKIAYLQQSEFCTWDFSVTEFVLQGRFSHSNKGYYSKKDYELVKQNLEFLNISQLAEKKIHQISGGEFQKVRLARALCQEPSFLILDEPAANLDFSYEPKLMDFLKSLSKEKKIGIILTIHNLNIAAQFADQIILLSKYENQKQLFIKGEVNQVFTKENLNLAFNQDFILYKHPINNSIQIL